MCAPDHEHCVDISPLVQVVTIGAAELEALRQQAARVPALEAQVARIPELEAALQAQEAQAARVPALELQVTRLQNDRWLGGWAEPNRGEAATMPSLRRSRNECGWRKSRAL